MPQVPYRPYSEAAPTQQGIPSVRVSVDPNAFGTNVARAIEHLGGTLEKSGSELFNRAIAIQQVQNRADADAANVKYSEGNALDHEKFRTLMGKAAEEALPAYLEGLETRRQEIRASLKSPEAQQFFDQDSRAVQRQSIFAASRHAGDEGKRYAIHSNQAAGQLLNQQAFDHYDDNNFPEWVKKKEALTRGLAPAMGWGKDETEVEVRKATSSMWFSRISGMSEREPGKAALLLEGAKRAEQLTENDYNRLKQVVDARGRSIGAKIIINKHMEPFTKPQVPGEPPPEPSVQLEKAKAEGRAAFPDDPLIEDYIEHGFRTAWGYHNADTKRDIQVHNETLWTALMSGAQIRTPQDFDNNPTWRAAWNALPDPEKAKWASRIYNFQQSQYRADNDEKMKILAGMRYDDPAKFLLYDPSDPDQHLSRANVISIIGWQHQLRKDPKQNYQVARALEIIKQSRSPVLAAMGILKGEPGYNSEDYHYYVGAVLNQLEIFQSQNGRPPTQQEIIDKIGPSVLAAQRSTGWFGGANFTAVFQRRDVPKEWADAKRLEILERERRDATPEEITQEWIRSEQWKLYKALKAKGEVPTLTPTPEPMPTAITPPM